MFGRGLSLTGFFLGLGFLTASSYSSALRVSVLPIEVSCPPGAGRQARQGQSETPEDTDLPLLACLVVVIRIPKLNISTVLQSALVS